MLDVVHAYLGLSHKHAEVLSFLFLLCASFLRCLDKFSVKGGSQLGLDRLDLHDISLSVGTRVADLLFELAGRRHLPRGKFPYEADLSRRRVEGFDWAAVLK